MKLECVVVYMELPNNYCAYVPDFPGCISTGSTWEEIQEMIREALAGHVEVMLEYGDPLPKKPMSVQEAMDRYCEPLTENEKETMAEFGESPPVLSTTFATIEVEVPTSQAVRASSIGRGA